MMQDIKAIMRMVRNIDIRYLSGQINHHMKVNS